MNSGMLNTLCALARELKRKGGDKYETVLYV